MATSHLSGPAVVHPPASLYRVVRRGRELDHSRINAADAALARSGNRFDVAGGGVLYFGSDEAGCFAETLARFRPTAAMRAIIAEEDPGFVMCGGVPQDWRARRLMIEAATIDPLPFVDVEDPDTHEFLTSAMAPQLDALGVSVLDVAALRGRNRAVTRAVSTWIYAATDSSGAPQYSGIRYVSRLGNHECWAVFDGTELQVRRREGLELSNTALQKVAGSFGLRIF